MHADFVLEGDLVDACKPGDRVLLTGVYKPLAGKAAAASGHFRSVVIVNSVEQLSQAAQASADISAADLKEMKGLAESGDVLSALGRSLAPSIYGHDWIKKARAHRGNVMCWWFAWCTHARARTRVCTAARKVKLSLAKKCMRRWQIHTEVTSQHKSGARGGAGARAAARGRGHVYRCLAGGLKRAKQCEKE